MSQLAKWFGASLVVHLAAAGSAVVLTSGDALRPPDSVMVVLDTPTQADMRRQKTHQASAPAVAVAAAPSRKITPERPEPVRRAPVPATLPAPALSPVREDDRTVELPQGSPAVPGERTGIPVPATPAPARAPKPHAAPTVKSPSPPEPAEQMYRKEHFAFIRELIARRLEYPPLARRMKWSGKTVVTFTIAEDGTAHAIRVTETSGFPILDNRAVATVERAAPFPRPPVAAEIVVPINFILVP